MKFLKTTLTFVAAMLLMAGTVIGQGQQMQQQQAQPDDITDEELENFVTIFNQSQEIQEKSQEKLEGILEDEDMDLQRFQTIMMSQQNPQMGDSVEMTEEEEETIERIQPQLMEINQESQQEFVEVIQDNGMEPQRFQQIMQAVQSDPDVAERFQEIASDSVDMN